MSSKEIKTTRKSVIESLKALELTQLDALAYNLELLDDIKDDKCLSIVYDIYCNVAKMYDNAVRRIELIDD